MLDYSRAFFNSNKKTTQRKFEFVEKVKSYFSHPFVIFLIFALSQNGDNICNVLFVES